MVKSVVLPMAREISAQVTRKWVSELVNGIEVLKTDEKRDRVLMELFSDPALEQAALDFVQIEKVRRFDSCLLSDLDQLR
jgi:hypothetical protein